MCNWQQATDSGMHAVTDRYRSISLIMPRFEEFFSRSRQIRRCMQTRVGDTLMPIDMGATWPAGLNNRATVYEADNLAFVVPSRCCM